MLLKNLYQTAVRLQRLGVMNKFMRFSTSPRNNPEPVEYTVDEKEIFSEKKMKEAQISIAEKLKAIKKAQDEKPPEE